MTAPGIYVSYPFCAQKCTYCNFASGVFPRSLESEYLDCLQSEIRNMEWSISPDTLYLGGGTPSQMPTAYLGELLQIIPGKSWAEATLEAAPGGITLEKANAWRLAGINRISLGVQSFIDRELTRTGRKHNAGIVRREIQILRDAGFESINVDLIAGLPGQTPLSWQFSLDAVRALNIPHVSVYMLEVDADSRLGQEVLFNGKRYGAPEIPSDAQIAEFYESAVDQLAQEGIARYEISNFARPGFESLHNLKYWRLAPYFGFGADAHSFDGAVRWQNVESPQEYVQRIKAGLSPRLPPESADKTREKYYVGLRLSEGVEPASSEWERWREPIGRFVAAGLLEQWEGRIRLTRQGVLLSNEVFLEFI